MKSTINMKKRVTALILATVLVLGLAPVMTINDEVHGRLKFEEIDAILAKYK